MKQPKLRVDIAKDFSKEPAGRYRTDGKRSGEVFRVEVLLPSLERAQVVEVVLDGTEGYGSSFLEEAFGGLIRTGMDATEFTARVMLISDDDPTLIDEVIEYVTDEDRRQRR